MSKKAYVCVGGPLDGEYATTDDFDHGVHYDDYPKWNRPEGMYAHLGAEYRQYNAAFGGGGMVWLHKPLAKPPIKARER